MLSADVIVPVPLHRDRYKERGFNQVDAFARPLAKLLKIPYRGPSRSRTDPGPSSIFCTTSSVGTQYVALLPYKRACELTICESCF